MARAHVRKPGTFVDRGFLLQEDGGYTLRGGPVDAFIAYAASSTKAGKRSSIYICTYTNVELKRDNSYTCRPVVIIMQFVIQQ